MFEPGDVVVVPFPYTNLKSRKLRPALVISPPLHQDRDVIVCGMTSNLANAERSVIVEQADMRQGRLAATSRVKATQVVTLEASVIRKRVGAVKPSVLEAVRKELRAVLGAG